MEIRHRDAREKTGQAWPQIDRLYAKLLTAFYEKGNRRSAMRIVPKLRLLITLHDPGCKTVLGAAARSVLAELEGDLWSAIRAREREIELLRKLENKNLPPRMGASLDDVSDRLDILAGLYWESGDLDKAEKILIDSQKLCIQHGIKFDGRAMLQELRKEKRALARGKAAPARRAS